MAPNDGLNLGVNTMELVRCKSVASKDGCNFSVDAELFAGWNPVSAVDRFTPTVNVLEVIMPAAKIANNKKERNLIKKCFKRLSHANKNSGEPV